MDAFFAHAITVGDVCATIGGGFVILLIVSLILLGTGFIR